MTDDPAEPEFKEIEYEEPVVAEVNPIPYWTVPEHGAAKVSPRMVRSWVFERVFVHDVPLNADTLGFMETVTQWLMNGPVEQIKLKVVPKPSASRPREE